MPRPTLTKALRALGLMVAMTAMARIVAAQLPYDPVTAGMPVIGFEGTYGGGPESKSPARVKVVLSQATSVDVTVTYTATGSAQNGSDFFLAEAPLTIPAGQTSAVIEFPVVHDSNIEGDETVSIILSNPQGAVFGQSVFTYVIHNDDQDLDTPPPPPFLSILPGDSRQDVVLKLSGPYSEDAQVDYQATITQTGSNDMHTLASGTTHIPAGQTTAQIAIPDVTDDIELSGVKTISVYLNNPVNVTLTNPMYSFSFQ
jgi:hypothetical protein